jgi:hypothetical protein
MDLKDKIVSYGVTTSKRQSHVPGGMPALRMSSVLCSVVIFFTLSHDVAALSLSLEPQGTDVNLRVFESSAIGEAKSTEAIQA